ncbi:MAG TPA: hypothetical protein PKD28_03400 [Candidatus Saccharibacteria bacterium]|nr:hypothetical protein [Candidatus Saccharibacteria bacterium]
MTERPNQPNKMPNADTLHAQEIHTRVYLEKGFIDEGQLNEDGLFVDGYAGRSAYFFHEGLHREVGARLISATKKDKLLSLPTAKLFAVDPDQLAAAAGVHRVSDLGTNDVVEVSGLAARIKDVAVQDSDTDELDPVSVLYAKMIRHSIEEGHKLWLLNADPLLLRDMKHRLGHEQVIEVGERQQYMGPPTKPAAINPSKVVEAVLTGDDEQNKQFIGAAFHNVDLTNASKTVRQLVKDSGISYTEGSRAKKVLTDPRTAAYSVILGYSAARALPVTALDEFEGSVPALWAIDVGTAIPYTWGVIETFSSNTPLSRKVGRAAAKGIGATVAASTFVAPYAYFYANGREYPAYVNAVIAGFVGIAGVSEVMKHRKETRIRAALQETDLKKA